MLNDYEEEMITEMMKIEQYLSHCCFVNEEGFTSVDEDFVQALEWCDNKKKNTIIDLESDELDIDDDLHTNIVLCKINYYEELISICKQEKGGDLDGC